MLPDVKMNILLSSRHRIQYKSIAKSSLKITLQQTNITLIKTQFLQSQIFCSAYAYARVYNNFVIVHNVAVIYEITIAFGTSYSIDAMARLFDDNVRTRYYNLQKYYLPA